MTARETRSQQARDDILGVLHDHRGFWVTAWAVAQELGSSDDGRSTGQHLRRMAERNEIEVRSLGPVGNAARDHYRIA